MPERVNRGPLRLLVAAVLVLALVLLVLFIEQSIPEERGAGTATIGREPPTTDLVEPVATATELELGSAAEEESRLRIVLTCSPNATTRFAVVDAATGERIQRFGLEVERDRGCAATSIDWTDYQANPRPVDHPGGELETAARPGLDRYTVCAPGYVRQSGDVQHESAESPRQVIALIAGGSLTGRVLSGGLPVARATLRLQPGRMDRSGAREGVFVPQRDTTFSTSSDGEGRFRYDMLGPGSYRLVASAAGGAFAELVLVTESGNRDLGALELVPGATILGQVLVPPRRPAAGLVVYLDLDNWRLGVKQITDAAGRFRFEGVPAGDHELLLEERSGMLASASAQVSLVAGESRKVVIDARASGTCDVTLTIKLNGRPTKSLGVVLRPSADPKQRIELGTTGADGRVASWAPALGDARVEICVAGWAALRHPSAHVSLELDRDVEASVDFAVGDLRIELPNTLVLPESAWASLTLSRAGSDAADVRGCDIPGGDRNRSLTLDGRSLRCEIVLVGEYEATLALTSYDTPEERIPVDGGFRLERRPVFETSFHASIRADETAAIRFP